MLVLLVDILKHTQESHIRDPARFRPDQPQEKRKTKQKIERGSSPQGWWTAPLFVLFFVLSGAELNLKILSNPLVLLVGVVYIIARSLGKYFGAYGSCTLTHCSDNIRKHLGITLLPQAGVALGMALTAQQLSDGAMVRSVVLFSVLVYELVGPALTKRSLIAAGEIRPEGRTNARRRNVPKSPIKQF